MNQCILNIFLLAIVCVNIKIITCDENCINAITYKLPICPPGYTLANGLCYLSGHVPMISCPTGYQLYNNSFCYPLESVPCVPFIAPVNDRDPPSETIDESPPNCPRGSVFLENKCRKLICSQGEYYDGRCLQAACPEGTVWRGRRCQDPEYVTTILDIENVFLDGTNNGVEVPNNSEEIDVVLVTKSPFNTNPNIDVYFNKTVIGEGYKENSGELDIEIQTQSPYNMNSQHEADDLVYFNKTEIKPTQSEELDINVSLGKSGENLDKSEPEGTQNLDIIVNVGPPFTLNTTESAKTFFNKTIISNSSIENDNKENSEELNIEIQTQSPNNMNSKHEADDLVYFNKTEIKPTQSEELDINVSIRNPDENLDKTEPEGTQNLDIIVNVGPPFTLKTTESVKTYFNKTIISNSSTGNENKENSGELDIEIHTQSPNNMNSQHEADDLVYFNKTEIKPTQSEELDISVSIGKPDENFDKSEPEATQNLDIIVNVGPPSTLNTSESAKIDFNKTIISKSSDKSEDLDLKVSIRDPNTSLLSNEEEKTYFDKNVVSSSDLNLSQTINSSIDTKPDIEAGSGDLDIDILIGQPHQNIENKELAHTTTALPTTRTSTTEAIAVSDNTTACCKVYTPRICKQQGKRWLCFNRSYKLCDERVCTHSDVYLKSPEIAYKSHMLIMPPNPPLPACASTDCESTSNCSGCSSYQRETCSSYCYRYLCPQDSCTYMDQQLFCTYYAGKFGCVERDGCIWNWCGMQNTQSPF